MHMPIGNLYGVHDLSGNYMYKKNVEKMMNRHNQRLNDIKTKKVKAKMNQDIEYSNRVH
jgi:hypothetical protein